MSCNKFTSSALYQPASEDTQPKWSNKSSKRSSTSYNNNSTTREINVINTAQYELKSSGVSSNGCCCRCYRVAVFSLRLSFNLKLCYITPSAAAAATLFSSHSIISNQVCVNFTCACISVAVFFSLVHSFTVCILHSRVPRCCCRCSLYFFVISMMICDVSIITVLLSGKLASRE